MEEIKQGNGLKVGYSDKINDGSFKKYIKNSNRWSMIFSLVLAAAALIGFFIYGQTSSDMEMLEAMKIGVIIASMFLLIALFLVVSRSRSKTFDGIVIDKKIERKYRTKQYGEQRYREQYIKYTVFIKENNGKKHEISSEDDDTVYEYYKVGDKVRHHAKLNTYEKYDKTGDTIIFCSACASLHDITEDVCGRCKCPLLK
ncbi:MAG: hypothetical protein JXQ23_08170 [Clostridia bacterium]|nr:hypothetical protein [Clostridia bacterium]